MKLSDLKNYKVVGYPTSAGPNIATQPDNRDALAKAADFAEKYIPGAQLGKALGNSLHGIIEAAMTRSAEPLFEAGRQNEANMGRIIGDTINAAATPATLAVGGGGLLAQSAKFAGLGAAASGGKALAEGADVPSALKSAATGGAITAAIPAVGRAFSLTGKAVSQALPKRLMQSAIGQSKPQLLAGKDVSEYALKNWKVGTPSKLIKDATASIENLNTQVQHQLTSVAPKTARILKTEVVSEVVKKINSAGGAVDAKEVTGILHSLAPQARALLSRQSMSLTEANTLRRALDKTLGDRGFLASQLPFNKEIMKTFDDVLREKVKVLAPGTRSLFKEMSKEITLRDAIEAKYAGQASNQVLNAFDIMLAGGGFLGGGPAGALATVAAKKVAQSATGKTLSAVSLNQLSRLAPVFNTLAPAQKALLVEVIASLVGQSQEAPSTEALPQPQSPEQ